VTGVSPAQSGCAATGSGTVDSVSVAVLVERLGRLSDDRMRQVCRALEVAVDCR